MSTDLALIRSDLAIFSSESDAEEAAEMFNRIQVAQSYVRDLASRWEEALIDWMTANGRDLTIGGVRYYVGNETTTKCLDTRATLETILEATGGDLDALAGVLAAQPFKHGAAKALGPQVAARFATETKLDLKTGKPKREVKQIRGGA